MCHARAKGIARPFFRFRYETISLSDSHPIFVKGEFVAINDCLHLFFNLIQSECKRGPVRPSKGGKTHAAVLNIEMVNTTPEFKREG
jgi:hypothetical protein